MFFQGRALWWLTRIMGPIMPGTIVSGLVAQAFNLYDNLSQIIVLLILGLPITILVYKWVGRTFGFRF
jgi:hypothetical protein